MPVNLGEGEDGPKHRLSIVSNELSSEYLACINYLLVLTIIKDS